MRRIPVNLNRRIFSKLFNIAAIANLTKEEFMKYEKDLMASWDEYAIKETLLEQGREEGREEGKAEMILNLLYPGKFSVAEIAKFVNVKKSFVERVKKDKKKK